MWNIMLDEEPKDWNGYLVNTDFRIGMQVHMIIRDRELSEREKVADICSLMFSGVMPPYEEIPEVLDWYLNGWYTDKPPVKRKNVVDMDYNIDQWRIYSAFLNQYHLDLNKAELHYWTFMGLLANLTECAFTRVVDIRNRTITGGMSPAERKAISEAKHTYSLEDRPAAAETLADREKEKEVVEKFMQYVNLNRKEEGAGGE